MGKRGISIIGTIVLVGIIAAARYWIIPELQMKSKGMGWQDAKTELQAKIQPQMSFLQSGFGLDAATANKVTTCVVDDTVAWLNSTECSYYYNEGKTTREEHLKVQEECLQKADFEGKVASIKTKCCLKNMPNTWSGYSKVFEKPLGKLLAGEAATPKQQACVAQKAFEVLDGSECKPLNPDAKDISELATPIEKCLEDPEISKKVADMADQCKAAPAK